MTENTVVYPARVIHTMNPARPTATHLAVRGDRIVAVGSAGDMPAGADVRVDTRFAGDVLCPGFVEAHGHVMTGALWQYTYTGFYPRRSPTGDRLPGYPTIDAVIALLSEADAAMTDPGEPLYAWGFDPLFLDGPRLSAADLDRVSRTRPIFVLHASHHAATVNGALMTADGIGPGTGVEGVVRDGTGALTGELRESAAMQLALSAYGMRIGAADETSLRLYAADAAGAGVTTVTDLAALDVFTADGAARYSRTVHEDGFPARIVPFQLGQLAGARTVEEAAELLREARKRSGDRLWLGGVKLILDGSIQGFTARLLPPGYLDRDENGIWFTAPDEFERLLRIFLGAGALVHVHCNGDEATELLLDVAERALDDLPPADHRLTVEHSQLTTPEQYRRMARLGIGANLFVNHIRYWGDQHADRTVGPERAARMNAAASALRAGVTVSLHSDTPVTPMNPLATIAIAATRRTASGRVLGLEEALTVAEGLEAVTLGAARLLKAEDRIGSLEPGKLADLVALAADPLDVADPADVEHIAVRATVVGGRVHPRREGSS
ncbi:amidohydrolase [Actinoplanes sp. NPDC051851]|uniref:amidohydrolase n=1 Tax=Actinoplanes sp. NPDC051851 TaxID=3154753 RepID=UPI0034397403